MQIHWDLETRSPVLPNEDSTLHSCFPYQQLEKSEGYLEKPKGYEVCIYLYTISYIYSQDRRPLVIIVINCNWVQTFFSEVITVYCYLSYHCIYSSTAIILIWLSKCDVVFTGFDLILNSFSLKNYLIGHSQIVRNCVCCENKFKQEQGCFYRADKCYQITCTCRREKVKWLERKEA